MILFSFLFNKNWKRGKFLLTNKSGTNGHFTTVPEGSQTQHLEVTRLSSYMKIQEIYEIMYLTLVGLIRYSNLKA
jgi:hypothetical protein